MKSHLHFNTICLIAILLLGATSGISQPEYYHDSQSGRAQNDGTRREQVEALRIEYLTNKLHLSSAEAKEFWPVYNNYRADLVTLRNNFFPKNERTIPLDADKRLDFEQKKLDLKKHYKPEFEQILGKEKLNLLLSSEDDFKKLLMQTLRTRREGSPPR